MSQEFISGCFGGCAGVIVGHPFDTIKVRLQTQDGLNPKYKGTWDCFRQTVQSESARGLYRGMSSPLVGVSFLNAIVFGVHGNIMKHLDSLTCSSHAIAGAGAGFMQSFIASPMELAKTRLQVSKNGLKNPFECLKNIVKLEGIKGLFRGQMLTIMREIPGFATYFGSYEYLIRNFSKENEGPSGPAILMAGGLAGIASWVLTYPIDVIKSRIQADGSDGENRYRGALHCLKAGLQNEGYTFLTRGIGSTIIRAFPTNAATFMVVSWTMKILNADNESEVSDLGDSEAWKDVISRGEILISSAALPITNKIYPTLAKRQEFLSQLRKLIKSTYLINSEIDKNLI